MLKLRTLLNQILNEQEDSYRGHHTAPTKENGAPLHDLSSIYPDDFYTLPLTTVARYYGTGEPSLDQQTISILQQAHNKPNQQIKIYRAVPKVLTTNEKIADYSKQKAYILKYGKVPPQVNTSLDKSKYYERLDQEIEKLQKLPASEAAIGINQGDWVTINKAYAKEHGQSNLRNSYRILSKVVPAKSLYTNGDSIHEFGYAPL
jgi:hypothetical protein